MAKKKKVAKRTRMPGSPREDYGKPIDGFIEKQKPEFRKVLVELRKIIEKNVPDAQSALKWGSPLFSVAGKMAIGLGAFKSHVNLLLVGPNDAFKDPKGRLEGSSKLGRHLKLRSVGEIPRAAVADWVKTAAKHARSKKK